MYDAADTDALLRDGLHRLPVPAVSLGFDARVLSALHAPPSAWENLWNIVRGELRPLLTGAACGLPVTVLALLWTMSGPPGPPSLGGGTTTNLAYSSRPLRMQEGPSVAPTLDALLDKPNLSAADLRRWAWAQTDDSPPALPPPAPRRRAALPDAPTLAA